jgi:hypothetical protein
MATPSITLEVLINTLDTTLEEKSEKFQRYVTDHDLWPRIDSILTKLTRIKRKEITADHDLIDEIPLRPRACKKIEYTGQRYPQLATCLLRFNVELFKDFLQLRNAVDILPLRKLFSKNVFGEDIFQLKYDTANQILKNRHASAYLYSLLCDISCSEGQLTAALKVLVPDFIDNPSARRKYKSWGFALAETSDYQWIGGISDEDLSRSTVHNWLCTLRMLESDGEDLHRRIDIDGIYYKIPKFSELN